MGDNMNLTPEEMDNDGLSPHINLYGSLKIRCNQTAASWLYNNGEGINYSTLNNSSIEGMLQNLIGWWELS